MKILYVINAMDVGGAQRLLSDLFPIMAEKHEVNLLVQGDMESGFGRKVREAGVKVMTTGCRSLYNPWIILRIAQWAKKYDIVHVHLFPMVYWASLASFLTPMKLVYTEHSTSNRRRGKWYLRKIEQIVYSRYQRIISISQQTQDALMSWLKVPKNDSRFIIINNGVNLSEFSSVNHEKVYPHTLIMVSRFVASKDQMTIIRALNYLPGDVHVIFVGDGENMSSCRNYADSYGLSERVHFVGSQTDVASWIAKADIGVQSSNWEGFGLTAVEMMAAGLPVVASDVDGLLQVVKGAGILFEKGNEKDFANQVNHLLNDKHFYEEVSKRCKERASHYDIIDTGKKYTMVYQSLIYNNESLCL